MLRLAVILAALWPSAVWAEGVGADPSSLVRDYGGWGLATVFFGGLGILWAKNNAKDEEIKGLNKDLVTAAREAGKLVSDNALAIQRFEEGAKLRAADDAERWTMLKRMNDEFTRIAMLVSGNGETMKRVEGRIDDIERNGRRGDR